MINYDEKMVLNSHLVIKMGIDQIGKKFVKSMSDKKFSYLGQFIQGLRTPGYSSFKYDLSYFFSNRIFLVDELFRRLHNSKFFKGDASSYDVIWCNLIHNSFSFTVHNCNCLII